MKLLEVVRGEESSDETMATVMALGKKMNKASVVSLNAPGFIGNRMLSGYTYQANMLLLEGALPNQVDNALESFGMSMGPFRMMDLVGLDLGWRARKLAGVESPLVNKISDELCEQDRFGQKNARGFYNYSEGSRAPNPAPENENIYNIQIFSPKVTEIASEGARFGEAPAKEQRAAKLSFKDSKNMGGV